MDFGFLAKKLSVGVGGWVVDGWWMGGVVDGMDGRASMRGMSRCSNFGSCCKCDKCIRFSRCDMCGRCIRRSRCYITKVVTKNCGRYSVSGRNV